MQVVDLYILSLAQVLTQTALYMFFVLPASLRTYSVCFSVGSAHYLSPSVSICLYLSLSTTYHP
jgi:hypothetical protein